MLEFGRRECDGVYGRMNHWYQEELVDSGVIWIVDQITKRFVLLACVCDIAIATGHRQQIQSIEFEPLQMALYYYN